MKKNLGHIAFSIAVCEGENGYFRPFWKCVAYSMTFYSGCEAERFIEKIKKVLVVEIERVDDENLIIKPAQGQNLFFSGDAAIVSLTFVKWPILATDEKTFFHADRADYRPIHCSSLGDDGKWVGGY